LDIRFHQSNREYEIIDWTHEARETAVGIVMNTSIGFLAASTRSPTQTRSDKASPRKLE
jgi:3-dehydroquinate dehydratase